MSGFSQSLTMLRDATALGISTLATCYVNAATGNNNNSGLSSGAAWQTLDHALSYIASLRWKSTHGFISLEMADGSYTLSNGRMPMLLGAVGIYCYSQSGVRANVTIDCLSAAISAYDPSEYYFYGVTFNNVLNTIVGHGVLSFEDTTINFTGTGKTLFVATNQGQMEIFGANTFNLTNSNAVLFDARYAGTVATQATITLSGNLAFSGAAIAYASRAGVLLCSGLTFSGAAGATGKRYEAITLGRINTGGGGANYFPGNAAGSVDASSAYS